MVNSPIMRLEALKEQALQQARGEVRSMLATAQSFQSLDFEEQKAMYTDLVKAKYDDRLQQLAKQHGLASQMNVPRASDQINDERHLNKRIDQAGDLAGDFVDSVDFPRFVQDLLKGVFDANLEVTLRQTDSYIKLMKAATASVSKYVREIDDTAAFGHLAENDDNFSFSFPEDGERNPDGSPKAVLTDREGNRLDLGDNEVKAKIMDAKIAMAREQRAIVRETILMGVSRLVVEKGVVKAAVVFDIKATERIQKNDRAMNMQEKTVAGGGSGGISLPFFGSIGGGASTTKKSASISVSSAKSESSTDLAAKITGSVEINFKSDYFKLDNFATMYGPVTNQPAAPAAPGQAPPAPPPPPGLPPAPR